MNGPCDFHDHPSYADVVAAAKAFQELNVVYRTQGRPSERLFKALEKARNTMERTACRSVEPQP